jgi:hypothetical protein
MNNNLDLKPDLNWSPKDDPDYDPENERPAWEMLFLFVLPWLLYFLVGNFFNLMH